MTYELFKQEVGSEQAQGNPLQKAVWAENANRSAVGVIEIDGEAEDEADESGGLFG